MPDRSVPGIHGAARDILARPEFRPPYQSPIDRLRHWVGEQIGKALGQALAGNYTLVGTIVLVLIVALLVWLVVRLVRSTRADPSVGLVVDAHHLRPADWLAEAAAREREGNYRAAVLARYRALVAELVHRGLVDDIPGRTSGEYRREVDTNLPATAADFDGATELFELAVYGDGPAGPPQSARLAELSRRVLESAR